MKYKRIIISLLLALLLLGGGGIIWFFSSHTGHEHASLKEYYTCAMHPEIISDKPGNCPICGMRLIKKRRAHSEHEATAQPSAMLSSISLSPTKQVLAQIKTVPIEKKRLTKTIRAVALVAFDRERYIAEQEYISALSIAREAPESNVKQISVQTKRLLEAAEQKLKLLGISKEELYELRRTTKADRSLYIENDGIIWLNASIYELDQEWIKEGSHVSLSVNAVPGESFEGEIVSIVPVVDMQTRTLTARIRVRDPERSLRPSMFANAHLQLDLGKQLAIPDSSVLNTGDREVVYVEQVPGRYQPRKVELGSRVDGHYLVISGVEEGERVVAQGGFLLDSEAELKSFGETTHQH